MRRTTPRSPSGRNFIGILFPKILELLDYLQVAALGPSECQGRDRYLGRWAGTVKPSRAKKAVFGGGRRAERMDSFWVFSGYLAICRNGWCHSTLFMLGSAGAHQDDHH